MPYKNEHAARIKDPGQFKSFARKKIADGITVILGIKNGKSETQAYRFDTSKFSPEEARKWLKDHSLHPIEFAAALEKSKEKAFSFFNMFKAKPTKYIKRVAKPGGGYTYIYEEEKHPRTVIDVIMEFFGLKDRKQAEEKIKADYKAFEISAKFNLALSGWADHLKNYFDNKEKWEKFFSKAKSIGKTKDGKTIVKNPDPKEAPKNTGKNPLKLSVMKFIHEKYSSQVVNVKDIPQSVETPNIEDKRTQRFIDNETKNIEHDGGAVHQAEIDGKKYYIEVDPIYGWKGRGKDVTVRDEKWIPIKTFPKMGSESKKNIIEMVKKSFSKDDKRDVTSELGVSDDLKTVSEASQEPSGEVIPEKIQEIDNTLIETQSESDSEDNFETMPEGIPEVTPENIKEVSTPGETKKGKDGSKVKVTKSYTQKEKENIAEDEEQAAREGYYNEKPSEILNVGADVIGARRHEFDTYSRVNVDLNQMEKDGLAEAYINKKNLFGKYGLSDKDQRIENGETDMKVLGSYILKEALTKVPITSKDPDIAKTERSKYYEFCRALTRLDAETKTAKEFYFGLADVFSNTFPLNTEESKDAQSKIKRERNNILGPVLSGIMSSLVDQGVNKYMLYSGMDKRERNILESGSMVLLSEIGPTEVRKTYDQIITKLLGAVKAAGVKVKKGDSVIFNESLKDHVYGLKTSFESPEKEKIYTEIMKEINDMRDDYNILYASQRGRENIGKKYGFVNSEHTGVIGNTLSGLIEKKRESLSDYKTVQHIYPETIGTVAKVEKDGIIVSFNFPDDRIRSFKLKPNEIKPETIESVKNDVKKKSSFVPNLYIESNVVRSGGKSFENMSISELQNNLTSAVKLRALQYGNSMPDDERASHTRWTLESMHDLSDILNIPIEQVSANGKLAMAFGARGRPIAGITGAVAHYEPGSKIINLTRGGGFGSLAHEWGHFMDNILSGSFESYLSSGMEYEEEKIIDNLPVNIPHGSIRTVLARRNKEVRYFYDSNIKDDYKWLKLNKGEVLPSQDADRVKFRESKMRIQIPKQISGIKKLAQDIGGLGVKSLMDQIEKEKKVIHDKLSLLDPNNKFHEKKISILMLDLLQYNEYAQNPYWGSLVECFARSFETYVADKLANNGRKNTYLASVAKTTQGDAKIIYPQGDARKKINSLFDSFFQELNKTQDMKKAVERYLERKVLFYKSNGKYTKI